MRSKFTALIIFVLFMILITIVISLSIYTQKMESIIEKQNITLSNYKNVDSLMSHGNRDLINSLTKFFDGTILRVEGKEVSPIDFLNYHNNIIDSLELYKDFYNYSRNHYGVNLKKEYINDTTSRIVSDPFSRADTASLLVPYYSRYVYKKNGVWYTETSDYEGQLDQALKKLNQNSSDNYKNLKTAVDALNTANKQIESLNKSNKKLRDILTELSNKGLVKIDTSKQGVISYEF